MSKDELALSLLASLVLEDGRRWGAAAQDFQWEDAKEVLAVEGETPYHFITRARGASKTSDLAGMSIAVMLTQLAPGDRCYALAADRDQGRLLLDSIEGFSYRTPELGDLLIIEAYKVIAPSTGTVLEVLPADAASSWGLRPAFVVVDEIAQWGTTTGPRQLWEAVSSAAAKVPNGRLVVLTTSGDPAHWSRKVLDHALQDELWRVHEVPGPAPWMDERRLQEQRRRLPESSYRRLFLNEWTAAEDRLANEDDLAACVTLDGPLEPVAGVTYAIAVDLGIKKDRTVGVVCHLEPFSTDTSYGNRVVLDRMHVWKGSRENPVRLSDVESWIFQASQYFGWASVIIDPWQMVGMEQRLNERGIPVQAFTFSATSVGRLALTLFGLIRDHALALPDDPELIDELANVRLRETSPGVLRMDHDPDKHDDRALALAMAAYLLLEVMVEPEEEIVVEWFDVEISPY